MRGHYPGIWDISQQHWCFQNLISNNFEHFDRFRHVWPMCYMLLKYSKSICQKVLKYICISHNFYKVNEHMVGIMMLGWENRSFRKWNSALMTHSENNLKELGIVRWHCFKVTSQFTDTSMPLCRLHFQVVHLLGWKSSLYFSPNKLKFILNRLYLNQWKIKFNDTICHHSARVSQRLNCVRWTHFKPILALQHF